MRSVLAVVLFVAFVNDAILNVSGTAIGAGVLFDLTATTIGVTVRTLTLSSHADGIGIGGGSPTVESDNRNSLASDSSVLSPRLCVRVKSPPYSPATER